MSVRKKNFQLRFLLQCTLIKDKTMRLSNIYRPKNVFLAGTEPLVNKGSDPIGADKKI